MGYSQDLRPSLQNKFNNNNNTRSYLCDTQFLRGTAGNAREPILTQVGTRIARCIFGMDRREAISL